MRKEAFGSEGVWLAVSVRVRSQPEWTQPASGEHADRTIGHRQAQDADWLRPGV